MTEFRFVAWRGSVNFVLLGQSNRIPSNQMCLWDCLSRHQSSVYLTAYYVAGNTSGLSSTQNTPHHLPVTALSYPSEDSQLVFCKHIWRSCHGRCSAVTGFTLLLCVCVGLCGRLSTLLASSTLDSAHLSFISLVSPALFPLPPPPFILTSQHS